MRWGWKLVEEAKEMNRLLRIIAEALQKMEAKTRPGKGQSFWPKDIGECNHDFGEHLTGGRMCKKCGAVEDSLVSARGGQSFDSDYIQMKCNCKSEDPSDGTCPIHGN